MADLPGTLHDAWTGAASPAARAAGAAVAVPAQAATAAAPAGASNSGANGARGGLPSAMHDAWTGAASPAATHTSAAGAAAGAAAHTAAAAGAAAGAAAARTVVCAAPSDAGDGSEGEGDDSGTQTIHESESGLQLPPHDDAPLIKIDVRKLHPTQLAVGAQQVVAKAAKMAGKGFSHKAKKRDKWLSKRPIPVVLGPPPPSLTTPTGHTSGPAHTSDPGHTSGPVMYLVDHHHLARALLSLGLTECYCQVVEDVSDMDAVQFWEHMRGRGYVWPFDASGHEMELQAFAASLPHTVEGLADDPFRSLAALVRNAGGYEKVWVPFSEFRWANWLRSAVPAAKQLGPDHPTVMQAALAAACLPEAAHLPGFLQSKKQVV